MEENYLIALFVVFIFSFVLFKKDSKAAAENNSNVKQRKVCRDTSGVTGVAKYLRKQEGLVSQNNVTGVARYLQEKQGLAVADAESSAVSGVAKYLAGKEKTPVSGVSKYMARQAIQAKKMAKENLSGVEKYLNNRG